VVQTCTVVRDNHRQELATTHLVPGDVVLLSPGGKVPADGVILAANRLNVDEAIMTGESSAVTKKINDQLYMGTTIQTGQATLLVTQTGSQTKIGSIAQEIQTREPATPLQQQLQVFSKNLVILILLLTSCIFLIGLFKGEAPIEMLSTSVALAVSSIPEGLVISLTVVLAIGMQKILRRRGLVRKLSSAETLGGITTICLDKTGTLTEGKMQVVEYLGDQEELATQMLLANDLDDPIVIAAYDWALQVMGDNPVQSLALDNIPFSPKERFSLTLHQLNKSENIIYVNGAPDILLRACKLSQIEKKKIIQKIDFLTSHGKRVMGLARKKVPSHHRLLSSHDGQSDLEWVGLLAFFDPIRSSVKEALQQVEQAGVRVIVITGDYAKTAQFILAEIGMAVTEKQLLLGEQIEKLSDQELADILKRQNIQLCARTTPDQKDKVVRALQLNHEIVAMMGDGVNDAPALHQAEIGIVVNEASDVARESADLVLLDSHFSTVAAAIEEGRSIFERG
jgi:Ca2+-transporting ATPase